MAASCDALIGYDTYPHVDLHDRGREAGHLLVRMLREGVRPRMALAKPPLMPHIVRQRTAEIGVRIAIGAEPSRIFRLVVGQGVLLSAVGIAIGWIAALGLTRFMGAMLVGVKPADPSTFAAMAVLFVAIAAVASWIPARRAARIDPTQALRQE